MQPDDIYRPILYLVLRKMGRTSLHHRLRHRRLLRYCRTDYSVRIVSLIVSVAAGLSAHGRPLPQRSYTQRRQMAKFVRSMLSSPSSVNTTSLLPTNVASPKPQLHSEDISTQLTGERERCHTQRKEKLEGDKATQGGKFVTNFYTNMMNKDWAEKREERGCSAKEVVDKEEGRREDRTTVKRRVSKTMKEQTRDQVSEKEKDGGRQRRRKNSTAVQDQEKDHEQHSREYVCCILY